MSCAPDKGIVNDHHNTMIWYTYPAQYWNSQSLHMGKAYMGASFFGGVEREKFSLTEGSMWCGGPFRGDWEEYGVNPRAKASMDRIRKAVVEGNIHLADSLSNADYLVSVGAAVLLPQTELNVPRLLELLQLLQQPQQLLQMAQRARERAMPDAAQQVAAHCIAASGWREAA